MGTVGEVGEVGEAWRGRVEVAVGACGCVLLQDTYVFDVIRILLTEWQEHSERQQKTGFFHSAALPGEPAEDLFLLLGIYQMLKEQQTEFQKCAGQ